MKRPPKESSRAAARSENEKNTASFSFALDVSYYPVFAFDVNYPKFTKYRIYF
jgi:hypothetical protein